MESRPQLIENIIIDQHLMLWSWIKRAYYKNSTWVDEMKTDPRRVR